MDTVIQLLQHINDPAQIEEVTAALGEMKSGNKYEFIENIYNILQKESVEEKVKSAAITQLWGLYPEEIVDADEEIFEDENQKSQFAELNVNLLQAAFHFLTAGTTNLTHHAITLFALVGNYIIHRFELEDVQPLQMLLEALQTIQDTARYDPLCKTIATLLRVYYPEETEASALFHFIIGQLSQDPSPQICESLLYIINALVECMPDFFENEEEGDERAQIVQGLIDALVLLAQEPSTQRMAFTCWRNIGKFCAPIVGRYEETLIPLAAEALGSDDPQTLIESCLLLKRIAKIEIDDETEELNGLPEAVSDVVPMLVDVCSSVDSPDCPMAENWVPADAAFDTLKEIAILVGDPLGEAMEEAIVTMLESAEFPERDAALRLAEAIIMAETETAFSAAFLQPLMALAGDEAPRVRYHALKCLRKALQKIYDSDKADPNLIEFASTTSDLIPLTEDEPAIASEAAGLLAIIAVTPGYEGTDEIMEVLLTKAVTMHQSFAKDPFSAVEKIVTNGPEESVLKFLSTIVETLGESFEAEDSMWLVHDLGELVQAYAYRFETKIADAVGEIAPLLLQAASSESEYAHEALLPLAALGVSGHETFMPFLADTLAVLHTALQQVEDNRALYTAATGASLLLTLNYTIDDIEPWIGASIQAIQAENTTTDSKCAIISLLDSIAKAFPEPYAAISATVLGYIRSYCQELTLRFAEDSLGTQNVAAAIAEILLTTIKNYGFTEDNQEMAGELVIFVGERDRPSQVLLEAIMPLIEFMSREAGEYFADLVTGSPDVVSKLRFVVEEYDEGDCKSKAQAALDNVLKFVQQEDE